SRLMHPSLMGHPGNYSTPAVSAPWAGNLASRWRKESRKPTVGIGRRILSLVRVVWVDGHSTDVLMRRLPLTAPLAQRLPITAKPGRYTDTSDVSENPVPSRLRQFELPHADDRGSFPSPDHADRRERVRQIDAAALHSLRPSGREGGRVHLSAGCG